MKTLRVEQHKISNNFQEYSLIDELSFKSKNLYNYANYHIRQEFINNNKWIRRFELDKLIRQTEPFKELCSDSSEYVIQVLDESWKSFFALIKDYGKNPSKYKGKPRLPNYQDKEKGRFLLGLKGRAVKIDEEGFLRFQWKVLHPLNKTFKSHIGENKIKQVRFVPKSGHHVMEIVYEIEVPDLPKDHTSNRIASIDIGVNNLAAITSNVPEIEPIIINGKPLKSINQFYNKQKAKMQSELELLHKKKWSNRLQSLTDKRNNKIKDYLHKASHHVIEWCVENQIDTLVVGQNKNWKQETDMGKRNNQNFVSIPFDMFKKQLAYKCENVGVKYILNEESYSSGTSFLDEEAPTVKNYDKSRRVKRGLFNSNKGVIINADLNGSYQIMKKVFPNVYENNVDRAILHPKLVKIDANWGKVG